MTMLNEHSVNWFAVMWDCHGLEAVQHIPDHKLSTFARLAGHKPPDIPNLQHWRLRAQFNPQRHYEIYLVSADPGIDTDEIRAMFDSDPQTAADTCRRLGQVYFSDRYQDHKVAIR